MTSLAKPCRSRLLIGLSGGGIVRLGSSLSEEEKTPLKIECISGTLAICFRYLLVSQVGFTLV